MSIIQRTVINYKSTLKYVGGSHTGGLGSGRSDLCLLLESEMDLLEKDGCAMCGTIFSLGINPVPLSRHMSFVRISHCKVSTRSLAHIALTSISWSNKDMVSL